VTLLNKLKQLPKTQTADCCNTDNDPESLQVSGQVIQDSIPDEIFQRVKLGIHGNDLELVEQRTKSYKLVLVEVLVANKLEAWL